jgi:drug/metabolite transporter (DMT)-like permease
MPASALLLALAAALVHAVWNMLLAGARDSQAATGVAMAVGCLAFAPVAVAGWDVRPGAWPFVVASAALELLYFALLALAYSRFELSAVYPLARGSAPVIVLLVSVVALGASLSFAAVAGVLAVAAGVVLARGAGAGQPLLALAVGAAIAGYTLVDKEGLRHADPLPYLELVLVVPALAYLAWIGRRRAWVALGWRAGVAGVGMFGAYALVLAALRLAAAAPVAAVRETSIVIAVLLGALVLHEPVGRRRAAGAVAIVAGVAAIALA